jgi:hypothetical protein
MVGLLLVLAQTDWTYYHSIDISSIGFEGLENLKYHTPEQSWWIELGDTLLMHGTNKTRDHLQKRGLLLKSDPVEDNYDSITIVGKRHFPFFDKNVGVVLMQRHGITIYKHNSPSEAHAWFSHVKGQEKEGQTLILPFQPNLVLVRKACNDRNNSITQIRKLDDPIPGLVALVDEDRWFSTVVTLASFNRYTLGTDIRRAQSWIIEQIRSIGSDIEVTTQQFTVGSTTAYNIIAKITGTTRPNDWYIVGAHYDSTSQTPTVRAPGAEDNGSGSAGVLEMLRIFHANPPPATIFFILYSGEEQGLYGSTAHVRQLINNGDRSKVKFVITMDMIGYTRSQTSLNVLVESYRDYEEDIQIFVDCAYDYVPQLGVYVSYNPFGSDHMPYLQNGFAAALAIENDWDIYPGYHRTTDEPSYLTRAMGRKILQMNVAALAKHLGMETL